MPVTISVFDLFRIGIGPSSSHTVGPMRAARRYLERVLTIAPLADVHSVRAHLYGSLAATGVGHGTVPAVMLGLSGAQPHLVDPDSIPLLLAEIEATGVLRLLGQVAVPFRADTDVVMHADESMPGHPNGMRFEAFDHTSSLLSEHRYYSVGGGFVVDEDEIDAPIDAPGDGRPATVPHPFRSADELVAMCAASGTSISQIQLANERELRSADEINRELLTIWQAMRDCASNAGPLRYTERCWQLPATSIHWPRSTG